MKTIIPLGLALVTCAVASAQPAEPIKYATVQVIGKDDSAAVIAEKAAKVLPRPNQAADPFDVVGHGPFGVATIPCDSTQLVEQARRRRLGGRLGGRNAIIRHGFPPEQGMWLFVQYEHEIIDSWLSRCQEEKRKNGTGGATVIC